MANGEAWYSGVNRIEIMIATDLSALRVKQDAESLA